MTNNISNLFNKHFDWNTTGNKTGNTKNVTAEEENILKKPISEILEENKGGLHCMCVEIPDFSKSSFDF